MFKNLPRNKVFLAPIAGICDPAFRAMCEEYGAGLTFSELTSIDFIYSERQEALREIYRSEKERCVGLQLFGKNPSKIKDALEVVDEKFDFFDFNAGCPANNIIGQGAGADLLGKPALLKNMLNKIISNTNKPVTLKYRLGLNKKTENFLDIGRAAEDLGVSMVTLHARHVNQRYSGSAKWDRIKMLKDALNIPVTGNGDIRSPEDARDMLQRTNCDYVMIGRWARGNPFCFKQVNDFLNKGVYEDLCDEKKISSFLDYFAEAKKYGVGFSRLKIQAMQFSKGVRGGVTLRRKLSEAKNEEQIIKSMRFFLTK